MQIDACFQLGYVIKKHGLNGEVSIFLDVDFPEDYKKLESVFVEINQKLVPFFIQKIVIKGNKAQVKFEEVDDLAAAENLKSKAIYLPLEFLPDLPDEQFYFHQVIGYAIVDEEKGEIGVVENILSGPKQDLFSVLVKGKEVLVPVSDDIVIKVNHGEKKIDVDLPNGLLEIYLD